MEFINSKLLKKKLLSQEGFTEEFYQTFKLELELTPIFPPMNTQPIPENKKILLNTVLASTTLMAKPQTV